MKLLLQLSKQQGYFLVVTSFAISLVSLHQAMVKTDAQELLTGAVAQCPDEELSGLLTEPGRARGNRRSYVVYVCDSGPRNRQYDFHLGATVELHPCC